MSGNEKDLEKMVRRLVEQKLFSAGVPEALTPAPSASVAAPDVLRIRVVTEREVREAGLGGIIYAAENAIVTDAAEDLARAWGVTIEKGRMGVTSRRRIAIGADHGGFEMKADLAKFLATFEGAEVLDLGTHSSQSVDYPDFAQAVAEAVAAGKAELGIIVDGAGIGSAIAANKVPGIRAAMCYDVPAARNSREHNFANVLTLGGRTIDAARMREIVKAFLETPNGEERHAARVRKIMAIERKYAKS